MILSGQDLVNTLNSHCNTASQRIWIASPFIGSEKEVFQIIGGNWMRSNINFRILTDIDAGFIREDTFNEIKTTTNSEIRTLLSLHAKIYLIDDWCLITSANLTGTAFSRRYEIGQECNDIPQIEALFSAWWEKATPVDTLIHKKINRDFLDYQDGKNFTKKCKLPKYTTLKTDKFLVKCDKFIDFANFYEKVTGRNQKMVKAGFSLYQEVDYFFNFLYHDAPDRPSNPFAHKKARNLTTTQRAKEVQKYFKQMPYDPEDVAERLQRSIFIKSKLDPRAISRLKMDDVKQILDCMHCLWSRPFHKIQITKVHTLSQIRDAWNDLLNTGNINAAKIEQAKKSIKHFGDSSASELIAWYMPDKYPMMNLNSESGMRFFGISI